MYSISKKNKINALKSVYFAIFKEAPTPFEKGLDLLNFQLKLKLIITYSLIEKMLSENERIELQNKVRDFYNSKKGEKILRKNNKKLLKDFKKKRGWFSKEEDEAWKHLK